MDFFNLKHIRSRLGLNQHDLADLLGVSIRAVQSYEQGWRTTPPKVLLSAWLLVFFQWRGRHGPPAPCWELNNCRLDAREKCFAYRHNAGDLCWFLSTQACLRTAGKTCAQRIRICHDCPAMRQWMDSEA